MLKDRGNIKWTSLMLSEHRDALKKLKAEEGEQMQPELDLQKLERLDLILKEALVRGNVLKITYFADKRYHQLKGIIKKVAPGQKEIFFQETGERGLKKISHDKIIEINIIK